MEERQTLQGAMPDVESLVRWEFTEEKKKHSRDRELLVIVLGLASAVLAVMAKTYVFALLLVLATLTLVHIHRKKPRKLMFNITEVGLFLDDDFVDLAHIKGFNIIDDPGETARLILKIERIIHINEIIPIYDVRIEDISGALMRLGIPKEEALEPTLLDYLTSVVV